ncbi:MAG: dihydroorotate dehydrogenase electron transfer subunit [Dehalococcoidia bacterium]
MHIKAPDISASSKPGQFLMLTCGTNSLLRRPISIHGASSEEIELLYAVSHIKDGLLPTGLIEEKNMRTIRGAGTKWLSGLKTGDKLDVIGPLGNGFQIDQASKSILIVAGGIGIAPLKFLAETALSLGKKVTMLVGARTMAGIYPSKALPSTLKLVPVTEDGSVGIKSTVIDIIPAYSTNVDQIFACGPEAMYEALNASMERHNIRNPVQVSLEVRMGCGTGVCYSCSIKTKQGMKRVCKEGPVFNIRDIIWQEVRI